MDFDHALLSQWVEVEKLRNKRFFITGATGFFGLNLLESLLFLNKQFQLNMGLTVLVRDINKASELFTRLSIDSNSVDWVESDLLNVSEFDFGDKKFDFVLHFAANANWELFQRQPEIERDIIIRGTDQMLDLAKKLDCRKFIYLSSGAVYGKQPPEILKWKESDSEAYHSPDKDIYGSAKVQAEKNCRIFGEVHGLDCTILRGFAFAGAHLKLNSHYAIGNLIGCALQGDTIVVKEGTTIRSYLYIVDAMIWILRAAVSDKAGGTYNLGSDESVAMEDLAYKISSITGNKDVRILSRPPHPNRYVPNIDLAKEELGVQVYTSLDQTIRHMIEWNEELKWKPS